MRRIGQAFWSFARTPPFAFAILAGIYGLIEDDQTASAVYFAVIAFSFIAIWVVQELRPTLPEADYFAAAVIRMEREPSADLRQAAAHFREMFVSFKNEGFTDRQALDLVATIVAKQSGKTKDDE